MYGRTLMVAQLIFFYGVGVWVCGCVGVLGGVSPLPILNELY